LAWACRIDASRCAQEARKLAVAEFRYSRKAMLPGKSVGQAGFTGQVVAKRAKNDKVPKAIDLI